MNLWKRFCFAFGDQKSAHKIYKRKTWTPITRSHHSFLVSSAINSHWGIQQINKGSLAVFGELKIEDCWRRSAKLRRGCPMGGENLAEEHGSDELR
jgi:hypothetical protein